MAQVPLFDVHGQVREPLLVVELDGADALPAAVAAALRSERILVGVLTDETRAQQLPTLLAALDVTLVGASTLPEPRETVAVDDPWRAAQQLRAAAAANPHAAIVLAGLLQRTGVLPVAAALDAESFAYSTLLGGPEFAAWLHRRGPRPQPPPEDEPPVLVDRLGDELRITLNRPRRHNAHGAQVRDGLVEALDIALHDPDLRVVLDGAGPTFSSGGDLDEFGTTPDLVTAHFVRTRAGAARPLHQLSERTTVHIHGTCIGAGVELPAFAGRVIAHPDTTLRLPEVGMGLIPGAGGTVSIPRRIGRWRTLYLALTGTAIDADTALRWGLIDGKAARER